MDEIQYTAYLEGSLRLSAEGLWHHNGTPFTNQRVSDLLSRAIEWDEQLQQFFIRLGPQRASFTLDDTPLFVTCLDERCSPWMLTLSNGATQPLVPQSLRVGAAAQLYCLVSIRSYPSGRLMETWARFTRPVHQQLLEHAVDEQTFLIDGVRVPLTPREVRS